MNLVTPATITPATEPYTRTDAAIRAAGGITALFLVAGSWPMARWASQAGHDAVPPLLHALALGAMVAVLALGARVPRVVRDWLPLALGPFLYIELRWLIAGAGVAHADAMVIGWEHAVFGGDPSSTWAVRQPSLLLSELLHLCYASYYLLVLVPPVLLYVRGRRTDFARTLLALAIVYAVCFGTYLLLPVDGPRYLIGPAAAPEGPVRSFVLNLLAAGSSRGTAFPSSHVAASVVAALCSLRAHRRLGIVVAALTVGLTLGTVYGGFHYGVDALAGLVTGVAAWAASLRLWSALSGSTGQRESGVQRATAA